MQDGSSVHVDNLDAEAANAEAHWQIVETHRVHDVAKERALGRGQEKLAHSTLLVEVGRQRVVLGLDGRLLLLEERVDVGKREALGHEHPVNLDGVASAQRVNLGPVGAHRARLVVGQNELARLDQHKCLIKQKLKELGVVAQIALLNLLVKVNLAERQDRLERVELVERKNQQVGTSKNLLVARRTSPLANNVADNVVGIERTFGTLHNTGDQSKASALKKRENFASAKLKYRETTNITFWIPSSLTTISVASATVVCGVM